MTALIPPIIFAFAAGLALASLWHDFRAFRPALRTIAIQMEKTA